MFRLILSICRLSLVLDLLWQSHFEYVCTCCSHSVCLIVLGIYSCLCLTLLHVPRTASGGICSAAMLGLSQIQFRGSTWPAQFLARKSYLQSAFLSQENLLYSVRKWVDNCFFLIDSFLWREASQAVSLVLIHCCTWSTFRSHYVVGAKIQNPTMCLQTRNIRNLWL